MWQHEASEEYSSALQNAQDQSVREHYLNKSHSIVDLKRQSLILVSQFGPNPKEHIPGKQSHYYPSNDMTMSQLVELLKKTNNLKTDNQKQQYVAVWRSSKQHIPLQYTMKQIKKEANILNFNQNLIYIYKKQQCPFSDHADQSLVYKDFQNNQNQADLTFKIILSQNGQDISRYIYLKIGLKDVIFKIQEEVKKILQDERDQNNINPIINGSKGKIKFKFYIKKDIQNFKEYEEERNKINKELGHQVQKSDEVCLSDFTDSQLRKVCPPKQIIQIRFQNDKKFDPNQLSFKEIQEETHLDVLVEIIAFSDRKKKKPNNLNTTTVFDMDRKVITRRYLQIRAIKLQTLLTEQQIQQPLTTSAIVLNSDVILRPRQFFQNLDAYINSFSYKIDKITLISLPEYSLYYKQFKKFSVIQTEQIQTILNDIYNFRAGNNTGPLISRSSFKNKRLKKIKNNPKIKDLFCDEQLLDFILVYTSEIIYERFNYFLRCSALSLYQPQRIAQDWLYRFCSKLIQSLSKISNHHGNIYRVTVDHPFNYKLGQIVQWNGFSSTSKCRKVAFKFLARNGTNQFTYPYLFQIETFSGKYICPYSFVEKLLEQQVIVMPNTRFVVKSVQTIYLLTKIQELRDNSKIIIQINPAIQQYIKYTKIQLTVVKMLELPCPKCIPGNIFIWIDPKTKKNSQNFNEYVKKYKLKDYQLITLKSNQHFIYWLNEFKNILILPDVNIRFITNMNRSPNFKNQGLQTLQIIRSFGNDVGKNHDVMFYINDVKKTCRILEENGFQVNENLEVSNMPMDLVLYFVRGLSPQEVEQIKVRQEKQQMEILEKHLAKDRQDNQQQFVEFPSQKLVEVNSNQQSRCSIM